MPAERVRLARTVAQDVGVTLLTGAQCRSRGVRPPIALGPGNWEQKGRLWN